MEPNRSDASLARPAAAPRPRRAALRLVAAAVAALFGRVGVGARAADAAGCAKVDKPCRRASQCCAGICRGPRGKKTCRGHGAGTCRRGQSICTAPDPELLTCNNRADCFCLRTTAGTSFCYDTTAAECAECERDADCVALGHPAGSACAPTTAGRCAGECESGTICVAPCE